MTARLTNIDFLLQEKDFHKVEVQLLRRKLSVKLLLLNDLHLVSLYFVDYVDHQYLMNQRPERNSGLVLISLAGRNLEGGRQEQQYFLLD